MGIESAQQWVNSLTVADLEDLLGVDRGKAWRVRSTCFDVRTVSIARVLETFRERAADGVPKGADAKVRKLRGTREYRPQWMIECVCVRALRAAGLLIYNAEIGRLVAVIPPGVAYGNQFDETETNK